MTRTIKPITMKSSSWGIVPHDRDGHFFTGFVGGGIEMLHGQNVIITDAFQVEKMRRGRSAAEFTGHFSGAMSIAYQMGMESMLHIIQNLQSGRFTIDPTGYIVGDWTFKKQGQNILLHPVT